MSRSRLRAAAADLFLCRACAHEVLPSHRCWTYCYELFCMSHHEFCIIHESSV